MGDPNRLQQVVWNLLSNAVKFTPKGGRVQTRLTQAHAHVEIEVSDTGQGIPLEFLPHVFERFRQADASTTRRHTGLGLGLAIVRHLVELHGGSVIVLSGGEGRGASFTVSLPALEPEESRRARTRSASADPLELGDPASPRPQTCRRAGVGGRRRTRKAGNWSAGCWKNARRRSSPPPRRPKRWRSCAAVAPPCC